MEFEGLGGGVRLEGVVAEWVYGVLAPVVGVCGARQFVDAQLVAGGKRHLCQHGSRAEEQQCQWQYEACALHSTGEGLVFL